MKRFTAFLFTFLCSLSVFSQQYVLDIVDIKLTLSSKYYNVEFVVDGRLDHSSIVFNQPIEKEVLYFIWNNSHHDPKQTPLVIRIKNLEIKEVKKSGFVEAIVKLELDFLIRKESDLYLVKSFERAIKKKISSNAEKKYSRTIARMIQKCFSEIDKINLNRENPAFEHFAQVDTLRKTNIIEKKEVAMDSIFSKGMKKGVYLTYDEFVKNNPAIKDFDIKRTPRLQPVWEGTFSRVLKFKGKGKVIKEAWGFSDGKNVYVFHQFEYFKVEFQGDQMSLYGYNEINDSAFLLPGLAGGLIGRLASSQSRTGILNGMIGGALGGGIAGFIIVSKAKRMKVKYVINSENGKVKKQRSS